MLSEEVQSLIRHVNIVKRISISVHVQREYILEYLWVVMNYILNKNGLRPKENEEIHFT